MLKLLIEYGAKPSLIASLFAFAVERIVGLPTGVNITSSSLSPSAIQVLELLVANGVDIHMDHNGRNGFMIALEQVMHTLSLYRFRP
jgi:hypothetical protein